MKLRDRQYFEERLVQEYGEGVDSSTIFVVDFFRRIGHPEELVSKLDSDLKMDKFLMIVPNAIKDARRRMQRMTRKFSNDESIQG